MNPFAEGKSDEANWSFALDLMILWKTFRAVLGGQGAY